MSMKKTITDSYAFKLNALTRKMRRHSLDIMRSEDIDLTVDQWGILSLLHDNKSPMSQTEIAVLMIKDSPTVSRIIDILCKRELLVRETHPADRRRFNLRITKLGIKAVKLAMPVVERIREGLFDGFTKQEFAALQELIAKIESNMACGDPDN